MTWTPSEGLRRAADAIKGLREDVPHFDTMMWDPLVQYRFLQLMAAEIDTAATEAFKRGQENERIHRDFAAVRAVASDEFERAEASWQKAYEDRTTPYKNPAVLPDIRIAYPGMMPGARITLNGELYEVSADGLVASPVENVPARSDANDILRTQADADISDAQKVVITDTRTEFPDGSVGITTTISSDGATVTAVPQGAAALIDEYLGKPLGAAPQEAQDGETPPAPTQATRPKGGRPKGAKDKRKRKARKDAAAKKAAAREPLYPVGNGGEPPAPPTEPILATAVEAQQDPAAAEVVPPKSDTWEM